MSQSTKITTSKKIFTKLIILLIVVVNIGCDQVSKTIVREKVAYNENISIIDHHFTLTKIENSGAFLSFGDSLSDTFKFILLSILPLIALALGVIFLLTKTNLSKPMLIGLCFAIGGGIGNIYDRIVYGSVTDFLHIDFVIFQTGIFNMADVSIMIGMFIILTETYFKRTRLSN